jgi:hypothetical protein
MGETEMPSPTLRKWIGFGSIVLIVIGVFCISWSQVVTNFFWQSVLLGIGLALAPSGVVALLTDWLVFGHLIEGLRLSTTRLREKTDSLESEIISLRMSTNFLKQSSDLGLEMIYTDRGTALRDFAKFMEIEVSRGDAMGKLIIVGSSIKGMLENVKKAPEYIRTAINSGCELHILLTHPEYSPFRENQEDRPPGAIEDEIFDGLRELESCVHVDYPDPPDLKLAPKVKLYKGTPTCFMIVAGNHMLINPYPYEEEAYRSFCVAVRKVEPQDANVDVERTIFAQYLRAHFEKPWNRNAVPYRHYWLEGPNPNEAWDRKSCYGDVFVVQDSSHFYMSVNLIGQRQADVRGMPTSIPCGEKDEETDYLILPEKFSIRLFDTKSNSWHSLDKKMGLLTLHPERRRGKASKEVSGNLLNDYKMLGLFDAEDKVVNSYTHPDNAEEGLRGQPLPLFYVWLGRRA